MTISDLSKDLGLSNGAALWIVSDLASSQWARQIDWHLNSQIMKADRHKTRDLSSELQNILKEQEETAVVVAAGLESPLMIASSELLPNQVTVMVPYRGDAAVWARACAKVAVELRVQTARVFLPDGVKSATVRGAWTSTSGSELRDIQLLDLP